MDRMEAMCRETIPTAPAGSPEPRIVAMQSVAIPLPPAASTASPPQPLPINNLERMKMVVILIPPSMTPDHPQQSISTEVADSQRQPFMITGDMPTLDECQGLEQAELAMPDVDDNFLHMLHMFKSWYGADFPPSNIPYNKDLNRHVVTPMPTFWSFPALFHTHLLPLVPIWHAPTQSSISHCDTFHPLGGHFPFGSAGQSRHGAGSLLV
ncbi:hypothetical protein EDD16DRAFT_1523580 [Pisolithus croceorrhizus]|nr:hypothetical protein EDD16DRAFT_1523580 [Pisolithus croceorrhizus]KAI6166305.1 hypothetical protein EDD17DRAFT_1505228 [Pisolithus thermaeus]